MTYYTGKDANDTDVIGGWSCPECNNYLEQDGQWLYCLNCGYDEEEEKQDDEELD